MRPAQNPLPQLTDALDSQNVANHLNRARAGDAESWSWLVERYSPLLEVQAGYRLGVGLRRLYDARDLVNDVWLVAFRKLPEMPIEEQHAARDVLRFLSAVLLNRVADLVRKHIRRGGRAKDLELRPRGVEAGELDELRAFTTSVLTRAARSEARALVRARLDDLRPDEQVLLVLRFIEGLTLADVAKKLDEEVSTVSMRCSRLLPRLRVFFPATLVDELAR